MAPIPDPNTVAERWATGIQNNQEKMRAGIQAVTVDPGQRAIAAGAAYIQNVQRAYTEGRWQRGLQRSGLEGWRAPLLAAGVDRAVQGAVANKAKFADRIARVLQFETQLQQQISTMPNVTDADKEARMLAWTRGMRTLRTTG